MEARSPYRLCDWTPGGTAPESRPGASGGVGEATENSPIPLVKKNFCITPRYRAVPWLQLHQGALYVRLENFHGFGTHRVGSTPHKRRRNTVGFSRAGAVGISGGGCQENHPVLLRMRMAEFRNRGRSAPPHAAEPTRGGRNLPVLHPHKPPGSATRTHPQIDEAFLGLRKLEKIQEPDVDDDAVGRGGEWGR